MCGQNASHREKDDGRRDEGQRKDRQDTSCRQKNKPPATGKLFLTPGGCCPERDYNCEQIKNRAYECPPAL